MAGALGRASEIAIAHVALAKCARSRGDEGMERHHVAALRSVSLDEVSAQARAAVEAVLGGAPPKRAQRSA
jgi:hypothetical protein